MINDPLSRLERAQKHAHGEAFCVMKYACDRNMAIEFIWNSRDGVTPFMLISKDGHTKLTHVKWGGDRYAPDHKPKPGDRIFVDMTREMHFEKTYARIKGYFEDDSPHGREFQDRYAGIHPQEIAESFTESEWCEGMPDIQVVE